MKRYSEYRKTAIPWLEVIPSHWEEKRAKNLFNKENRIPNETDEVITCFRDGTVTLRKNRRTTGFTESFKEIGYQGIKKGDLVIHQMDAFAGATGVSDSNGKGTPVYSVCTPKDDSLLTQYYAKVIRHMGLNGFIQSLYRGIRERSSDFRFETFARQILPVPPLSEQEQIVTYLDDKTSKIDTYIAEKEKELNLYKQLIEANIYSKNSNDVVTFTSWESFFDNSWNTRTGKGLFEEVDIKGINSERFLAVTQDKGLIYKDEEGVNFVTAEKKETQKLVCPGQFVISLRSFEGGIEYSTLKGLVSPAYVILKLKKEYDTEELQMYFKFLFKSEPFVSRLNSISDSMRDGKSIKFADIKRFPFPIPSDEKLKHIFKLSRIYDVKKDALCKEKILINQYKQRLISDSVTGQINVQNI